MSSETGATEAGRVTIRLEVLARALAALQEIVAIGNSQPTRLAGTRAADHAANALAAIRSELGIVPPESSPLPR